MRFTPNLGPATRVVYMAIGAVLVGVAWWGGAEDVLVALSLTAFGAIVMVEGAVGF